ncbi:hypothetical protein TNCV_2109261 [Trichonephila clavipes]|nr:hypothetical protein TNCV_2109261 [Trichonephila clavipes]
MHTFKGQKWSLHLSKCQWCNVHPHIVGGAQNLSIAAKAGFGLVSWGPKLDFAGGPEHSPLRHLVAVTEWLWPQTHVTATVFINPQDLIHLGQDKGLAYGNELPSVLSVVISVSEPQRHLVFLGLCKDLPNWSTALDKVLYDVSDSIMSMASMDVDGEYFTRSLVNCRIEVSPLIEVHLQRNPES